MGGTTSVPVEVVQEDSLESAGAITLTTDHAIDFMLYLAIIVLGLIVSVFIGRYFGCCLTGHERKKMRMRDREARVRDDVEARQELAKADPNHGKALIPVPSLAASPKKGKGKDQAAYTIESVDT